MNILVYNGTGTERVDVLCQSLNAMLQKLEFVDSYHVVKVSSEDLYEQRWLDTTKLFILPGGRDIPYVRDITGKALENIRTFINNGGSYLGLCAGAYFSCSFVCFEQGTALEVIGSRELALFKGTANGSVYPGFKYLSTANSRSVPLTCNDKSIQSLSNCCAYFNGGCEFISDCGFSDYEPLLSYSDFPEKQAIVTLKLEKGKVVLSGVHPEMDPKYLSSSQYNCDQWSEMLKDSNAQETLFKWIVKYLLDI